MTLPVADEWFTAARVDAAITRIEEPHVDPWVSANSWHIRGAERDLLIDSGLGVASIRDFLARRFPDREPVVIATHGHLDHMGGAHEFREFWAHELEPTTTPGRGTLSGPQLVEMLGAKEFEFQPGPIMISALPWIGYDHKTYKLVPSAPTRMLGDGDDIDIGGRTLRVLHLPGHTPGSIALYDADRRVLFSGDVIYDPPDLLDELHESNRADYVRSMRRLLDLDVDVVHSGHGEDFDGTRLREIAQSYISRVETA